MEEISENIKKELESMLKGKKEIESFRYLSPPIGILRRTEFCGSRRKLVAELSGDIEREQISPQTSVDRVSVTFAEDSIKSDISPKCFKPKIMEKHQSANATDEEETEDEDYSASVNAIMKRRESCRRSKRRGSRRASSPFNPEIFSPGPEAGVRRRSSVYTSSSGETAITVEESVAQEMTQEQIFENIKLHKEVLSNVKMQPWNMRRKLKLVVQAKNYIKRHEGALQERFTQSRSIKDMLARWNIYLVKKWQHYRREMANLSNFLIPWELRIKEIESHFGSAVASYFIFLRWLFWINLVTAAVLLAFVAIPENKNNTAFY